MLLAATCLHLRRPDYKKLGVLKQQFPDVPVLALTATATDRVCQDLKEILRISACELFRSSVDRPNLFYSVWLSTIPTIVLTYLAIAAILRQVISYIGALLASLLNGKYCEKGVHEARI